MRYRITAPADVDLERLYDDGIDMFGESVADRYYDGLLELFANLTVHPKRGAAVDEIRQGYRRAVYESHSVYYRIEGEEIIIARVLGRQSTDGKFSDQ